MGSDNVPPDSNPGSDDPPLVPGAVSSKAPLAPPPAAGAPPPSPAPPNGDQGPHAAAPVAPALTACNGSHPLSMYAMQGGDGAEAPAPEAAQATPPSRPGPGAAAPETPAAAPDARPAAPAAPREAPTKVSVGTQWSSPEEDDSDDAPAADSPLDAHALMSAALASAKLAGKSGAGPANAPDAGASGSAHGVARRTRSSKQPAAPETGVAQDSDASLLLTLSSVSAGEPPTHTRCACPGLWVVLGHACFGG